MKCTWVVLMLLLATKGWTQIVSSSADGVAQTSYTNGNPNDDIFIFCGAGNNGVLEVNVSSGSAPYTYQWYQYSVPTHSWSIMSGQTNATLSNLSNGGYRVEVADNAGNLALCDVAWIWNVNLTLNALANISGCGDVNLNVNIPPLSYTYFNPPGPMTLINNSTQITVCFSGQHTWVSDLGFYLVGPAGCGSPIVTLAPNNGSICNQGNNFNNLCFTTTNSPNFNVCNQNTPLTGNFDSAYGNAIDWSPIYGCNASESGWSVMVFDCEEFDTGALTSSSIQFQNLVSFCGGSNGVTYNSGAMNSPINDNSCNVNSASSFTVPVSTLLTTPLLLMANITGTWSTNGTASIVDVNANATQAIWALSGDVFTYSAAVNIGSAICNFNDDVVFNNNSFIPLSLSYPVDLCEGSGSISPILSGPAGGQYTSLPAGLSISSNGTIQTSTSIPGTYVVTYTKTSAGCTQSTSVGITIQDIPESVLLSPSSICEGDVFNGTAQTAFEYEYFLNGVSQAAPSTNSAIVSPALAASDDWCVRGYQGPGIVIDGNITESYWGTPLAAGNGNLISSFGSGNHLDALYVSQYQNTLAFGIAGQLESGSNNRLLVFLDTETGGFNQLSNWINRSNAPYYSLENLSGNIQFDGGFEPDYVLAVNTGASGESYVDLYHMASNVNHYLGSSANPNFCAYLPSGNNYDVALGYEFQFDLSELNNPQGQISLFAMLVNNPGSAGIATTLSNQFLSPAGDGELSYGDGLVNFNMAIPNPVFYVIGTGNCYLENCLVINPNQNLTLPVIPDQCLNTPTPFALNNTINGITGTWSPNIIDVTSVGTTLYSFTPTSASGCYADGTASVNVVDAVDPAFIIDNDYCQGETPGSLPSSDGFISGTWSPVAISTGAAATAGPVDYLFTPNANQCAADFTLTVTVNPTENPVFSMVTSLCQNATSPTLPTVDDNGVQGSWNGTVNTANIGMQPLIFTPVADPLHACAVPTTVNFNITNGTPSTFASIGPFCETENPSLPNTSNEGFTGTWTPSIIDMNDFTAAGQTFAFQPDPNQCASPGSLTLVVQEAVDAVFNFTTSYCQNAIPVALPINAQNGFTGAWFPTSINTANVGSSSYVFTPDAGNCANITVVDVTINAPIAPTFNLPVNACENATAPILPLNSSNAIAGVWSPNSVNTSIVGIQNFVFSPNVGACASVYNYSIDIVANQTPSFNAIGPFCINSAAPALPTNSLENISGTWSPSSINTSVSGSANYTFTPIAGICAVQETVPIIVDSQINPTFFGIPVLCSTETAPVLPLVSNNNLTGSWSPNLIDMNAIGTSTYVFTSDPNQCAGNANLDVTIDSPIDPLFSFTTSYCIGDAVDVLPTSADNLINGSWSPSMIDANSAGVTNHVFTVDAGQCANDVIVPVTVNAPTNPVFNAFDFDFCLNEIPSILPLLDDNGMSGSWNPAIIATGTSGNFQHTFIPDQGECGVSADWTVVVNDLLISNVSGLDIDYCLNDLVQTLPLENDDLIPGTWNPSTIQTNLVGTQQYVFTPDAGNCYTDFNFQVETFALPVPMVSLSDPVISCNVPMVTLSASGGVSYLWSDGSQLDAIDVTNSDPIDIEVTDVNGCIGQSTISVPMDTSTSAQLNYPTDVLNCLTTTIDIDAIGGQSFSWSPNGEFSNSIAVTQPGNYGVDITFDNGCMRSLEVDIVQDTTSPIGVIQNLSPSDILTCAMPNITLVASGGVSYQWINGGGLSTQSIVNPGVVECEVTGPNFCLDTVSYEVFQDIVPPLVNITPSNTEFDCFIDNIDLIVGGNAIGYNWSNGLGTNAQINCTQSGNYAVTGVAANGCTSMANIFLPVNRFYPDSNFVFSPFEIWDDNPTITLDGPDQLDIEYHWSVNGVSVSDLNNVTFDLPSFTPETFEICMKAYYSDICQSEECMSVLVKESLNIYIPNSFTPGSDGVNDGYRPVFSNESLLESYQMEIYNRWGEKVFETDDPHRGWDGSMMNTGYFVPDGSYTLVITYRSIYSDEMKKHIGQITFTR